MALDDLVRSVVATANDITSSLQVTIQHSAWIDTTGRGAPTFASANDVQALVEQKMQALRSATGELITSKAKITILSPIEPNGATGRREPIDQRDKFVLPDGTTGPILAVNGMTDPDTLQSYLFEVYLG